MEEMIVKITPEEAELVFPCADPHSGQADPSKVNDTMMCDIIKEVVANCGLPDLSTIDERKYWKCLMNPPYTDIHGDTYFVVADILCTMMNNEKIVFKFVCLC